MLIRSLVALRSSPGRSAFEVALVDAGAIVQLARDPGELWTTLRSEPFDLVFLDVDHLGEAPDVTVRDIRSLPNHPEVVAVERRGPSPPRGTLVAAGCAAVLPSGLKGVELAETLQTVVERRREALLRETAPEAEGTKPLPTVSSPPMRELMQTVAKVAASDSSILVLGETGVGKEWLARAIHAASHRARRSFVAINCAAIPESLLESELFGHERGAFTGAVRTRRGHFELAHSGTLFLDEIGDLPAHLQTKLLRVIQDREVQPVGSEKHIPIDVRIIAATNRSPTAEIATGRFRADLYFRLGVVTLVVPPLRERREDIVELADYYLRDFSNRLGRDLRGFDPEVLKAFLEYGWAGNVRELINVLERAVLLSSGPRISLRDLPPEISKPGRSEERSDDQTLASESVGIEEGLLPYHDARERILAGFDVTYLTRLLTLSGGRIGEAAQRSGLSERSLYDKMRRHGLSKETFKYRRGT